MSSKRPVVVNALRQLRWKSDKLEALVAYRWCRERAPDLHLNQAWMEHAIPKYTAPEMEPCPS